MGHLEVSIFYFQSPCYQRPLYNQGLSYVKMTEKEENVKFSKKEFFMNIKDMMLWISLDENTSLGSILNNVSCSENLYPRKPPSFCPHRRKNTFLGYI